MAFILAVLAIIVMEVIALAVSNHIEKKFKQQRKTFVVTSWTFVSHEEEYFKKIDNPEYVDALEAYAKGKK